VLPFTEALRRPHRAEKQIGPGPRDPPQSGADHRASQATFSRRPRSVAA